MVKCSSMCGASVTADTS